MPEGSNYDLVIVGGGMAGCILAARIAEHGVNPETREKLRIALLEAGPYFKGEPKPGYGTPLRRRMFTNVTHEFRENRRYSMVGGAKILGGSSMHYGAQAFLPFPSDYGNWNYTTGVDWSEENLKDATADVRRIFNVHADPEEVLSEGQIHFRAVARSLGHEVLPMEGAKKNCFRCGYCFGANMCRYDAKMSTLLTHVPIAEKNGVEIISEAKVQRILFDKGKAVGLIYQKEGQEKTVQGKRFILSCGTNQTPLLLWRSGFGPRDMLGNRTVIENASVGKWAHGHMSVFIRALFPEPIKEGDRGWSAGSYLINDIAKYSHDRLLIYDSKMGGQELPDQTALSEFAPQFGKKHKEFMKLRGRNLGGVMVWSVPSVAEGYLNDEGGFVYDKTHPTVINRLKDGIEMGREILEKMGAVQMTPVEALLRNIGNSHVLGTCRAGVDPKISVVDAHFRSHQVENLFICDGSAIPRTATGNSGMVVAAVATFAAQRIVQDHLS